MEKVVELPFNTSLSKNRAKCIRGRGYIKRIGLSDEYKDACNEAMAYCKDALKGEWQEKKKVWLKIMVFKPNHRSDPINLIDGLADVVKKCIPVDDRYYSINLDWALDKVSPRIILRVIP